MTRAVSRTTGSREPRVVEGRRREILVGVAHDGNSRLGGESGQYAIRRDVGDSGSGKSRRTQSRHSADLGRNGLPFTGRTWGGSAYRCRQEMESDHRTA